MPDFWKNKKIIAYIALAHHTRFITPIMEHLKSQGARVKYIVGQAERSQEITAIELKLEYSHIFDFVSDKDSAKIKKNYLLLRKTFAKSLKSHFLLGVQPVTVIDKTLYATATEYIGFRNLLKKEKPDLCFALHEINRWGKMYAFWAKKRNIPLITLQEGLAYVDNYASSGHAQYSTLNLVWGERTKRKLIDFEAPESKIIPVGNTHLAKEIKFQKDHNIREIKRKEYGISNKFVTLLVLSAVLPNPNLFSPIFKTVSENTDQRIFVKFHPSAAKRQTDKWIDSITDQFKENITFIHTQENTYNLISISDICVLGQQSTLGLEAIAFNKPLVKLDFAYTPNAPYSFVDHGVAIKMSADQLSDALSKRIDFSKLIDSTKKGQYLKQELAETTETIPKICHILRKTILANSTPYTSMGKPDKKPDKKWSIVIQVPDKHDVFLSQLEAIAYHSEDQGDYEIFLLEPDKKSKEITRILDSLSGDLNRIIIPENMNSIAMMNQAARNARGKILIFLDKNLAPLKDWLDFLDKAFRKHGNTKIFGARISNQRGKIANAGVVVDRNNTPISAYQNLNMDFPGTLKERNFQMTDHFIAIQKNLFFNVGGFNPDAGKFLFLDICIKTSQYTRDPNAIIYLPNLEMIFLDKIRQTENVDDSIYFYGKWNGSLWESEKQLLQDDEVTPEDLAHAKMVAAMQTNW